MSIATVENGITSPEVMDGIGAIELPLKGFGVDMVLKPKSYLNQNPYHCKDAVMLACDLL